MEIKYLNGRFIARFPLKIPFKCGTYIKIRVNGVEVAKKYNKSSARSVYRHMKIPIEEAEYDERKNDSRMPKMLTSRDERKN